MFNFKGILLFQMTSISASTTLQKWLIYTLIERCTSFLFQKPNLIYLVDHLEPLPESFLTALHNLLYLSHLSFFWIPDSTSLTLAFCWVLILYRFGIFTFIGTLSSHTSDQKRTEWLYALLSLYSCPTICSIHVNLSKIENLLEQNFAQNSYSSYFSLAVQYVPHQKNFLSSLSIYINDLY